ncbi:alanyl-tRNA editing protein AlaXM [soil metagenome]
MATDLLYQTDSYLQTFDARVTAIDREEHAVVLDRSAFYPGGGGQPFDTGVLDTSSGPLQVTGMKKREAGVLHLLAAGCVLPPVGDEVRGILDWERRFRLMRTHTALHVLCGVVFRDFGALVTGGNMDVDKARMDFELEDLSTGRVSTIEYAANVEIEAERALRVQIWPRDEAFRIPGLIRTKINLLPIGITDVRTVEIVGLDLQADGGTHVANTREVGGIRVIGTRSKGRINKRLEIVLIEEGNS